MGCIPSSISVLRLEIVLCFVIMMYYYVTLSLKNQAYKSYCDFRNVICDTKIRLTET